MLSFPFHYFSFPFLAFPFIHSPCLSLSAVSPPFHSSSIYPFPSLSYSCLPFINHLNSNSSLFFKLSTPSTPIPLFHYFFFYFFPTYIFFPVLHSDWWFPFQFTFTYQPFPFIHSLPSYNLAKREEKIRNLSLQFLYVAQNTQPQTAAQKHLSSTQTSVRINAT